MSEAPLIEFTISLNTHGHVIADIKKVPEQHLKTVLDSWDLTYENTNKLLSLLKEAQRLFNQDIELLEAHLQEIN